MTELTCIKCGSSDIYTRYHDAKPHCAECKKLGHKPPSCERDDCDRKDEHLLRVCRSCGWSWLDDVLEATDD